MSWTSSNYKPANVLRCVYDRIYVKLSHSVSKLFGYVLQCLHLFLQRRPRDARESPAIPLPRVSPDSHACARISPSFLPLGESQTPRSLLGENLHVAVRGFAIQQFSHGVYSKKTVKFCNGNLNPTSWRFTFI